MIIDIKNHGPPSVFYRGLYDHACDLCAKRRVGDILLRVCKGCSVSRYCSKECQTAAWPGHKTACKSRSAVQVPAMYASLGPGCATLAGLTRIGTDWTMVHRLSLYVIATILIDAQCGADATLAKPHTLIIDIKPATVPSDGTPATTFALHDVDLVHPEEDPRGDHPWTEGPIAYYRDLAQREAASSPPHPDYIGVVPVLVYFEGTPGFLFMLFPLYRRRGPAGTLDKRTAAQLEKVIQACSEGINSGTVLRIPTDPKHRPREARAEGERLGVDTVLFEG